MLSPSSATITYDGNRHTLRREGDAWISGDGFTSDMWLRIDSKVRWATRRRKLHLVALSCVLCIQVAIIAATVVVFVRRPSSQGTTPILITSPTGVIPPQSNSRPMLTTFAMLMGAVGVSITFVTLKRAPLDIHYTSACPRCKYSTVGLPPSARLCPECGWNLRKV